jgi:hypothetical protein
MIEWLLGRTTSEQWAIGLCAVLISGIFVQWFSQRLNHALSLRRDRHSRVTEACAAFRAPFADVVLNLRENPGLPSAQIANLNYHAILGAAQQFKPHIHWLRKRSFDMAVANYKQACLVATERGSILSQFASEQGDYAKAKRKVLDDAVHKLLSFAKQT